MIFYVEHLFRVEVKENAEKLKVIVVKADDVINIFEAAKISAFTMLNETRGAKEYKTLYLTVDGIQYEYRHSVADGFNPTVVKGMEQLAHLRFTIKV